VNWWRATEFWEHELPSSLDGMQCLEIGCGKGGISLWLASKGARVICSDYMNSERRASELHRNWNISERIHYEDIDATDIPYEGTFDIIAIK
jgi:2-polyprenyl-3-methyl-5-hydroxy-6-metoxy-1,4-benzoquinol methylase